MSDLLKDNITQKKLPEHRVEPTIKESFDAQYHARFEASLTFPEWNMEFRKSLYGYDSKVFDKWSPEYNDLVLKTWDKKLTPEEAALQVFQDIERLNQPKNFSRKRKY